MSKDNYLDAIQLEAAKLEVKSSKYWMNKDTLYPTSFKSNVIKYNVIT